MAEHGKLKKRCCSARQWQHSNWNPRNFLCIRKQRRTVLGPSKNSTARPKPCDRLLRDFYGCSRRCTRRIPLLHAARALTPNWKARPPANPYLTPRWKALKTERQIVITLPHGSAAVRILRSHGVLRGPEAYIGPPSAAHAARRTSQKRHHTSTPIPLYSITAI